MDKRAEIIIEAVQREQENGGTLVPASCVHDYEDGPCGDCEACSQTAEFSSQACEVCNSRLAGSRHAAALISASEPLYYSVCIDCLLFLANGDLPED